MSGLHPVFWFIQICIFLLGVAVGHSYLLFRIHREENRQKDLELALLEKRSAGRSQSGAAASDSEDEQYRAKVRQEIDDILSRN